MKQIIKITESELKKIVKESVRIILEDIGGTSTFSVNSPAGSLSDPTGQQKNHIDAPSVSDEETKDRHPGFSVDGKAKWNKNEGFSMMRRPMYNPKSGKKK